MIMKKQTLNEQIGRIKSIMNINENDTQAVLQQDTQSFNEKVGEDLTPEEYKEVICSDPKTLEIPTNITGEQKQMVDKIKAKALTASLPELIAAKNQLRELKKQSKQQQSEQAAPALITVLGLSMPPGFAIAIGGIIFVMIISCLGRFFRFRKTTTYYCDGTRSRGLFGLLRW